MAKQRKPKRHIATGQTRSALRLPNVSNKSAAPPILFDLDGTLVDSVYEHVIAWREALEQANIHLPNWKIHRRIGMSGKLFLPTLLRELGRHISASKIEAIEKVRSRIFMRSVGNIRILPGANELLDFLKRNGIRWALATSGDSKQVSRMLKDLDIPSTVPVITGDDIATAKPAPDAFVAAAERLGVSLAESVVVGDSPWDILAAQRTKALGVGLLSGGYAESELERAGAYRVYDDPAGLLAHIEELGIQTEG